MYIPVGAKINVGKLYFLPELGVGVNLSNRTQIITQFSDGQTAKITRDEPLIAGEFNKISIPLSLSVGTNFTVGDTSFSSGLKGYYGLNQVVSDVPRDNHYFGIGFILASNL